MARYSHLSLSIFSLLALFLCRACSSLDIPQGEWNLTTIDSDQKNAGAVEADEESTEGDMHLGPPGNRKGAHLASASAYLMKVNKSLADEVMSTAGVPAATNTFSLETSGANALWGSVGQNLNYYGGSILANKKGLINVIFYGKWSKANKQPIIDFLNALNKKNPKGKGVPTVRDWWQINSKNYYNTKKAYVTDDISVAGVVSLGYPLKPKGTSFRPLLRSDLYNIIKRSFTKGIKFNPNAVYLVLTSKDVYVDSFCSTTCSFHSYFTYRGKKLAYAFAGDSSSQCQMYCTYQYMDPSSLTYNGVGIDGLISMVAHELAGMSTNLFQGKNSPAGWVVANSQIENADLCSWVFSEDLQWVYKGRQAYTYNLVGPSKRRYIVQTNFNRKTGTCELKYKS